MARAMTKAGKPQQEQQQEQQERWVRSSHKELSDMDRGVDDGRTRKTPLALPSFLARLSSLIKSISVLC